MGIVLFFQQSPPVGIKYFPCSGDSSANGLALAKTFEYFPCSGDSSIRYRGLSKRQAGISPVVGIVRKVKIMNLLDI